MDGQVRDMNFDDVIAWLGSEITGERFLRIMFVGQIFAKHDIDAGMAGSRRGESFGQIRPGAALPAQPGKNRGQKIAVTLAQRQPRWQEIKCGHGNSLADGAMDKIGKERRVLTSSHCFR